MSRGHIERFELLDYPTCGSGAGAWAEVAGLSSLRAQINSASPVLTVAWQGSIDGGANAGGVLATPVSGTAGSSAANPADGALFLIDISGLTHIRANVTAYTSGSVGVDAIGMY